MHASPIDMGKGVARGKEGGHMGSMGSTGGGHPLQFRRSLPPRLRQQKVGHVHGAHALARALGESVGRQLLRRFTLAKRIERPHVSVHIPYAVNAASYTCFGMFMWIIVAGVCGCYRHAKVRTFGLVRATWALWPLLGLLLGRFVLHRAGLSVETAFPVMLLAAAVLLLASNAVFTESDLVKAMDIIPLARKRRFRAKCMRVIERYGLSECEGEIMIMLAKGRDLPYVQEHLYLSRSTVSTHRQHIYQKLEIHSQQELMNLVERAEE